MGFSLISSRLWTVGTATRRALAEERWRPVTAPAVSVERLEQRRLFAVTAVFASATGLLTVTGDALDNTITVSRDAAGKILVNGGAVAVVGGTPTVANTSQIQVFGQDGNDVITLDEANGALPQANLFGGGGNDTLTGGSGADQLFGQVGNDTLLGKGGNDSLFGGTENDVLTGGDGDDQAFGETGDDRMIWNPGDDTDLNEGGDGTDTVEVNGGNGAETFTVTPNGTRVRFDRVDPAPFSIDIGTSENLVVNANGGDDTFTGGNGLAALIKLTVDGGSGNDTINGGDGNDVLLGGDGNDFVDGNRGNDVVFLGANDDVFQWDPGDGSDIVEGQAGGDRMTFNGANIAERFGLSANGTRLRFTRDVANIVMDLGGMEGIDLTARGGADTLTVNDLSGTGLLELNANLSANGAGDLTGDGAADTVTVNATSAADDIEVVGGGSEAVVNGLAATVRLTNAEVANDTLVVNALGGGDTVSAVSLPVNVVRLTLDGGVGDDTLRGSIGADVLIGGDGVDFVDGNQGNDTVLLGIGDDTFQWDPGDGSDVVEGQDGADTMLFNGANIAENFDVSANGARVRFSRDVANIVMDLAGVESIDLRALGGADTLTVNDLTGTDLTRLDVDLRAAAGGGDGAVDAVTVNATSAADSFSATSNAGGIVVSGLQARVNLIGVEAATDRLTLNGAAGDDVINASGIATAAIQLAVNGGPGADVLVGGGGGDLFTGGQGNDTALLGAGDDTFVWNPGDGSDIVEGQAGADHLVFNGANIAENIAVTANGGRVRFTRDVAAIVMDLNDTESIDFNALGGADNVVVNDLTGTDVTEVNVNLAATGGAGDAIADTVTVNGTAAGDAVSVTGSGNGASVSGLAARVNVTGGDGAAAVDRVVVNGVDGEDHFTVVPSAGIEIDVDGQAPTPPAVPGDTLTVLTAGTTSPTVTVADTPTGKQGAYTFADRQIVRFSNIERLDDDRAGAVRVSGVFVTGPGLSGGSPTTGQAAFRTAAGIDSTFGYPVPDGKGQLRSLPWISGVSQVSLRFDRDVSGRIDESDLSVRGVAVDKYGFKGFGYDPATRTATWVLTGPVTQDKLLLVLDAGRVAGLDGEWVQGADAFPSGDGTAGGTFDFRVNVLRGDATGDGAVNALDLSFVKARLNKSATNPGTTGAVYSPFADVTMDGLINALDLAGVRQTLNRRLPAPEPAAFATSLLS